MINLTEYVNCCKTEIFEWSRICTEFALFQHQFWQEWVNDIFSEKNTISSLITQPWCYANPWNYTHEIIGYYWSKRTYIFLVWKLSPLKNKLVVYLPYKNYAIDSDQIPFFTFLHFPEDIKYCSCKNKAGKKLEGSNISVYEVYAERSWTKFFSRNSG